ncbi:hypothetical protein KC19_2G047000 [Ceratodon purpureus]|uniref:Uncharacterized protein n=1 Tax=Ceratodon purpureus TaxID=3225 RepID=A0A8T0IS30_CERPU|nr:hypothetical protein KC19_2G047000 [Ceratodon purpureus]
MSHFRNINSSQTTDSSASKPPESSDHISITKKLSKPKRVRMELAIRKSMALPS